jgi:group I intron endonuclease
MAVRLDQLRLYPAFCRRPPEGYGNVYWIRPIFSATKSKGYTGLTVQDFPHRLASHICKNSRCQAIRSAINKHGLHNFTVELCETNVSVDVLPSREVYWVDKNDTYRNGYNCTKGGEDMPMLDPNVRAKHKETMNSERVVEMKKKSATAQWEPGGSLRTKWHASFAETAKTPEYKAMRSEVAQEIRSRPDLEVQRGIAKRKKQLEKRAIKRATLLIEKEQREFDSNCRRQDKYNAKSGRSLTMRRILSGELVI